VPDSHRTSRSSANPCTVSHARRPARNFGTLWRLAKIELLLDYARCNGRHVLAFVLGFAASVLTVLVVRVQHGNYRAARDHMRRIEEDLSLEQSQRLTTSTLGGRRRVASVNHVVYLLLGALAAANLYGFLARLIASN
jgi:hypothetical protein